MYIIGREEAEAVQRVIDSGQLFRYRGGEGCETDRFETAWAATIGTQYALSLTSGTAALICGLVGLEIGPGNEVIVPGYTFMASALAVLAVGAVPIIVEVDESLTIDPDDMKKKITPRTGAIIPVHMLGLPCNMDRIMAVAEEHSLKVLEDACQAIGGSFGGNRLGSIGHAGAFSFNQFKIISCGEGGALVTDDEKVYQRSLIFHDGGCVFRDHADELKVPFFAGLNFRTNEILSAIMRVQLNRLNGILSGLRAEKKRIMEELSGVDAFTLSPVNDPEGDCGSTVALLFETEEKARAFSQKLQEREVENRLPIDTGRHVYSNWEPILKKQGAHHPAFDSFRLARVPVEYTPDMCPNTLTILARTVCLRTSPSRTPEELKSVINTVKECSNAV